MCEKCKQKRKCHKCKKYSKKCCYKDHRDPIEGAWAVTATRVGSPVTRPAVMTFAKGRSVNLVAGTLLPVQLFDDRSSFPGEWCFTFKKKGVRHYNLKFKAILFKEGNAVGEGFLEITDAILEGDKCHPLQDTLSGSFSLRIIHYIFEDDDPTKEIIGQVIVFEDLKGETSGFDSKRLQTEQFYLDVKAALPNSASCCDPRYK